MTGSDVTRHTTQSDPRSILNSKWLKFQLLSYSKQRKVNMKKNENETKDTMVLYKFTINSQKETYEA